MSAYPAYIFNATEEIDAAIFSGDTFSDPDCRKELREQLARWERGLKEWDKTPNSDE